MLFGMYAPVPHVTVGSKEISASVRGALSPLPAGAIDQHLLAIRTAVVDDLFGRQRMCQRRTGHDGHGAHCNYAGKPGHGVTPGRGATEQHISLHVRLLLVVSAPLRPGVDLQALAANVA